MESGVCQASAPVVLNSIELLQSSLTYRDRRLEGYDAAAVVEVIEHLDPPRLGAFERTLFEVARPSTVVEGSRSLQSTITRGRNASRCHAATLSRNVISSLAPPA